MGTPRNRRYNPGGGSGGGLGAILAGLVAGSGEVDRVPDVPPDSTTTDKPYDWSGKGIPSENRPKTKNLTSRDMQNIAAGMLFTGRGTIGTELASKANIENILNEQQAQRGLRTKAAEIPIDVQREQALTGPLVDRAKALATVANDKELQNRLNLDPLDVAKYQKENTIAILTAKGIVPNEENIAAYNTSTGQANISKETQQAYENIAKSRLGTAEAEKGLEISTKARPTDVSTGLNLSKYQNVASQQNLETQPMLFGQYKETIPGMAEEELTKRTKAAMFPTPKGMKVFDVRSPSKPAFEYPESPMEQYINQGIKAKLAQPANTPFGYPALGNVQQPQSNTNDIQADPTDPTKVIITMPDGRKIRVAK